MDKQKASEYPKMDASSSKKNETRTRPKRIPTKAQPDVAVLSPKKKLNTRAKSKKLNTRAKSKKLNTRAKSKKIHPTKAQPGASRWSSKKNMNTGTVLKKSHPTLAQPDVAVLSSKIIKRIKSDRRMKKGLAQVCTPEIPHAPEIEIIDCQSSEPSTSSGVKVQELYLTPTWLQGDKNCIDFIASKQKEKEDHLTRAYIEEDKDSWEFYGKGSSDIEFLLCPPPEYPPISVLGTPLNHLEKAAKKDFRGIQEIVLE